jgi:hypothetical protein
VSGPIAYVYYEEELANLLSRDERIAANVAKLPDIAKLPELLRNA